ncbi:Uncharacterized protein K02A2.6 [Trachymyrmex cornetzi]|uniref:Uncharacterized protein K02A2.6 n=1 Tax=Trachymyrmex cornetzi TaxID=471704 RepID=A0A151J8K5_9HYME|nr:Uncharacterized protein K02A2.6 [Trachymyrmex cornetzi]
MQQTQDEPIAKYYACLKSLAALCNFGSDLNNVLRDRFVSGLSSGKILDRLCEEAETKTIALKKETALSEMSASIHKLNTKQKFQNRHKKNIATASTKAKPKGYKKYKCKTCNEMGHTSKVCKKTEAVANYLSDQAEKSEVSEEEITETFSLNNCKSAIEPIKATIKINGKLIVMEVDSGAGMSVLSYNIYQNTFKEIPLQSSNIKLKIYDGSIITPVGEIFVTENFEFADVFDPNIGTYKYEKIQLSLKDNVSPIFCKSRPIPFAFRDLVEAELTKLEKQGVIIKVEKKSSRWGTPLVPVLRANKTLRLCLYIYVLYSVGTYSVGAGTYPVGAGTYAVGAGMYPADADTYPAGADTYPAGAGMYPTGADGTAEENLEVNFEDILNEDSSDEESVLSDDTGFVSDLTEYETDLEEKFVPAAEIRALNDRTKHCMIQNYWTSGGPLTLCSECMVLLARIDTMGCMYKEA